MKILYYFNFKEDHRASMDFYSNLLFNYRKTNKTFKFTKFTPKISLLTKLFGNYSMRMRYTRYISYPHQIKKLPLYDIGHVCEHQYAHLHSNMNSKVKFVTVHDLIPIIFHKRIGKWPYLNQYSLSKLKYFDKVFAVSQNTKKDILKYTDCPESKIKVLYSPVESFFNSSKVNKLKICNKYKLPLEKKKILINGNIFYKNLEISIKTLEKLIKINNNIIFIKVGGKINLNCPKSLLDRFFQMPFLKRKELPSIYKVCDLFFFPSIYEGYGLPCLEAMKCGIPIVCSNSASIPEVVGNAALKNRHNNVNGFVKDITKLLNNKKFYKLKQKQGLKRAKIFNRNYFHKEIIKTYKEELNKLK